MADPSPPAPLSPPFVLSSQDASRDDGLLSAETAETYMGESDCQELLQKVRNLMRRITAARPSPHPRFLHNLAAILEEEEERFEKEAGHPIPSSARSTYAIGRLVSLIRENDDFFELLSSRLLVGSRHSTAVRAGAARLLLACLTCGMYPDAFDDSVLSNIKQWVTEETSESDSACSTKSGSKKLKSVASRDCVVLKTYSLGLLAIALTTGGGIIEEMLGRGVASKLMHFLRLRVLKDSAIQKEVALACENKSFGFTLARNKDSRIKLPVEVMQRENTRDVEESSEISCSGKLQSDLLERERFSKDKEEYGDMICRDSYNEMLNSTPNADDVLDWMGDDAWQRRDKVGKFRYTDQQFTGQIARVDDLEGLGREEHSKWRGDTRDRGFSKSKGRRVGDGALEGDRTATLQVSGSQLPPERIKAVRDKSTSKGVVGIDSHISVDKMDAPIDMDSVALEMQSEFLEQNVYAKVGGVDISEYVRQAAKAAQAEAWAAKAPPEVIRAVGEAAAELVRAAALEVFNHSAGEELALNAAKSAAATVVNAAAATRAIKVSNQDLQEECESSREELEVAELVDCVPSVGELLILRERYSVQCLERLGEYLEVLGPVLHERGVDVCLALLQRESSICLSTKDTAMLLEVLKLICALAAHRKFSALFVDKGGVQQILAVPRLPQTYTGVSLCLFAFASVQGVMERVCTAPVDAVNELVGLALHLLEFAPDPARRNAALFFGAAFVFRAILDSFDAQDGLHRMLNLLQNAAATRSGGGSNLVGLSPTSRTDRGASTEVLTSYEKQTAYHTCIALRQYFRAHLLILIDSLRPLKGRSGPRSNTGGRAAFTYKPLDLSSEAVDALVMQVQRDKKVGPSFVKAGWQAAETFMHHSGHLTLLELTQVSPEERYLRDISQHALGILHILTLMPVTRKSIVSSILSNGRSGMAVILDAASAPTEYVEPEIIQPALLVLANLVCPPPSLSKCPTMSHNTPIFSSQQQCTNFNTTDEGREQHAKQEATTMKGNGDLVATISKDFKETSSCAETLGDKNRAGYLPSTHSGNYSPTATVVGDRKICLGSAAGGSGLAACIEQGYRHARDVVRANNGIKVLLHLLSPSSVLPPASSDCIRSLACRVLLGLARDNAIAHILTKLQVGKLLSELLREGSGHAGLAKHGTGDQGRWQVELGQVSMELIALVTNAGRTTTIVASDAAAPTLRRIERAAIAAATPINYPARELLQLIHEHLVLSGLTSTASALLKEAQLAPLPSVSCHTTGSSHYLTSELSQGLQHWPSGRVPKGFFFESAVRGHEGFIYEHTSGSSQKRGSRSQKRCPGFSSALISSQKASLSGMLREGNNSTSRREIVRDLYSCRVAEGHETSDTDFSTHGATSGLPVKRKLTEANVLSNKRLFSLDCQGPPPTLASLVDCRGSQAKDYTFLVNPQCQGQECPSAVQECQESVSHSKDPAYDIDTQEQVISPGSGSRHTQTKVSHIPLISSSQCQNERASLDSLVVQYLKHQHRQCPAPITTLPPLSLFHPHICPEPSRACYAPLNTAKRFSARETVPRFGGVQGRRRDRHFVYSRFRPLRPCRDERILLTSSAFLGTTFCLAASSQAGEICLFDCNTGNLLETHTCHQSSILSLRSASIELDGSVEPTGLLPGHLLLSSGSSDARLWNSSVLGGAPLHSFDGCKLACFNNSASLVAAISTDSAREVLLYDVETGKLEQRLPESSSFSAVLRGNANCCSIHFSPSDSLLLWKGLLWDHRVPQAVHQFDQFTDYGGGGFHPAGNEVIINSEIWDLRFFKLLRNVPSLNQTVVNFNSTGDVIYATLRRNPESANHRRSKHPLSTAFRTIDAVDYTDIATTPVDRCVLNLATESNNCLISVVGVDVHNEMDSIARLYEVGRRKPSDDDSDPDDGAETDDDEDDFAEEAAEEEDEEDGSDADESYDEDGSGDEDEAEEDVDADGDTNEEDDDAIEVDGSIVELISDGEDDENRMSYSSAEDASADDSDDGYEVGGHGIPCLEPSNLHVSKLLTHGRSAVAYLQILFIVELLSSELRTLANINIF
ncbi:hypothetical protein GOP47_0007432 [Adiantum capillus-veneris]|uniref:LisH domain-containing protein n=1 Tax=Adiantum capillus-veneris TaxID=13818 RepID=A0A9D4V0V9_ADICA|nr:hypothetical protein GOP47_0007432 [Adiantum capillus-veneris]